MATSDAPISIGQVALTVRDLDKTATFYEEVIGLGLIERNGESAFLGTEAGTLIELRQTETLDPFLKRRGCFTPHFCCRPNKTSAHG